MSGNSAKNKLRDRKSSILFSEWKGIEKMNIHTRNELLTENLNWVQRVINRNKLLIHALHLDYDDVYQDLCIAALHAIEHFDPEKSSSLQTHVMSRMQYEIKNLKRRYKPHGMTALNSADVVVLSLDYTGLDGFTIEIPCEDPCDWIDTTDILSPLSSAEREVVIEKVDGVYHRKKEQQNLLSSAAAKIMHFNDGLIAYDT